MFYDRMELHDIIEESWKFHLNLTPEFGKALYQAQDSNGKNSFSLTDNSGEFKFDAKIHIYQDKDPPEIS